MSKKGISLSIGVSVLFGMFFLLPNEVLAYTVDVGYKSFSDLPSNPLYKSSIEAFQQENIIVGYTQGGQPTGVLGATDQLKRSEFTKVASLIRLMETKNDPGQYSGIGLDEFTLKTDTLLRYYYKAQPGAPHFTDVPDKDQNCAQNPGGCNPWFTQYVNYAASQGMIKGYKAGDGSDYFDPSGSMLRIHALKLVIASDGSFPADQDPKVIRIMSDPRVAGRAVRCLAGAEDYILAKNGGADKKDAQNLLAYALVADKLDIFGNRCQAFTEVGAKTPAQRAVFLQQPIRRQEIARYFSLTTTYIPLMADPAGDPTVDTKEAYIMPVNAERVAEEINRPDEPVVDPESLRNPAEEPEIIYLNRPLTNMSVSELIAIHKQGRCCLDTTTFSCKTIQYEDYLINEEPELGAFIDGTALWHKATRGNEVCFVPFADIVNKDQQCNISLVAESLIEQYTHFDYPLAVRQIWTSGHSLTFKMYMQIGLDYALRNTRKFNELTDYSCAEYENAVSRILSGHAIAKLRFLSLSNNVFKNLGSLLK